MTLVPPNECMQAREALSARLDGELGELDGARLDAHLRVCAECRAYAARAAGATEALRAAELDPAPAGLFEPRGRRRVAAPAAAAAASLVIAAATGASFLLGQAVGRGADARPASTTTASAGLDPGVLAMLQAERNGRGQRGRVIPL